MQEIRSVVTGESHLALEAAPLADIRQRAQHPSMTPPASRMVRAWITTQRVCPSADTATTSVGGWAMPVRAASAAGETGFSTALPSSRYSVVNPSQRPASTGHGLAPHSRLAALLQCRTAPSRVQQYAGHPICSINLPYAASAMLPPGSVARRLSCIWVTLPPNGYRISSLWGAGSIADVGHTPEQLSSQPPQGLKTAQPQIVRRPTNTSSRMTVSARGAARHFAITGTDVLR